MDAQIEILPNRRLNYAFGPTAEHCQLQQTDCGGDTCFGVGWGCARMARFRQDMVPFFR